jgi:hypothetical protein
MLIDNFGKLMEMWGLIGWLLKFTISRIWQVKSWAKKLPKIWQAKCEKLTSFGNQPNTSQNHGLPRHDKFW